MSVMTQESEDNGAKKNSHDITHDERKPNEPSPEIREYETVFYIDVDTLLRINPPNQR